MEAIADSLLREVIGRSTAGAAIRLGAVVEVRGDGTPMVDFPGNLGGPVPALSTTDLPVSLIEPGKPGRPVLLAVDVDSTTCPIIIGVLRTQTLPVRTSGDAASKTVPSAAFEAIVDGRKIVLTGRERVELKCGRASILLRKDGKVVIKGTSILTRSTGANRIRGGSVSIN